MHKYGHGEVIRDNKKEASQKNWSETDEQELKEESKKD